MRTCYIAQGIERNALWWAFFGRKSRKEIYVYIQLIHFAVQQKVIHYKAKKKKKAQSVSLVTLVRTCKTAAGMQGWSQGYRGRRGKY